MNITRFLQILDRLLIKFEINFWWKFGCSQMSSFCVRSKIFSHTFCRHFILAFAVMLNHWHSVIYLSWVKRNIAAISRVARDLAQVSSIPKDLPPRVALNVKRLRTSNAYERQTLTSMKIRKSLWDRAIHDR